MAEEGMVPRIFAAKLPRLGTPFVRTTRHISIMSITVTNTPDISIFIFAVYSNTFSAKLPRLGTPFVSTGSYLCFILGFSVYRRC